MRESELVAKYKGEPTETSSVTDEEMKKMFAQGQMPGEEGKKPEEMKGSAIAALLRGMPPLPKKEDMEKARKTQEYADYTKQFDDEFLKGKPKQKELESATRKLDHKFHLLTEHNKEMERSDCDVLLYKNVILITHDLENTKGLRRCYE